MADASSAPLPSFGLKSHIPDLPLVIWTVLLMLVLGFWVGVGTGGVFREFNTRFGRTLGEFALILLPSLTLAAALSRRHIASKAAGRTAALASPVWAVVQTFAGLAILLAAEALWP